MRFQWLKDYQELEEQILYLRWNLNKSNLELARWKGGDLSNVRLEKNSRASSLEEKISKIYDEIRLLEKEQIELLHLVDSFKGVDNQIVKMKYIDDIPLEDIADEIGYSISYVRKRHTEIKKTLSFLDEYEERRLDREKKIGEIDYYNSDRDQLSLF
ncbi:hypothetical protein [Vagococcus fluvialis]|uniref:hypothetical protein n=1 Tax=Vagococcus fluvialis TaxID=2738 RepID=UPI001D0B1965|nr:hypothetical protein [Vagococcus fluvialis]UDM70153.1 hypothetical protein K5L00_08365 [Vagococcus fluvialis]UDM77572.1 hypothetical protein K5K98_03910 [Vagococcus fluvialis]UDM81842.1 hypothetical protein K5K96_10845 [Vagococcus fluvialis]